jgi:hypothetical protein
MQQDTTAADHDAGTVTHETQYFAAPFPAPASRAALAERIPGREG